MRHFVFRGLDKPGAGPLRTALREDHRAYIRQGRPNCRTVLGGPLLADDGSMLGTLLVFEAYDRDAVLQFLAGDPYAREGLFAVTEVHLWNWGLGQPSAFPPDQR